MTKMPRGGVRFKVLIKLADYHTFNLFSKTTRQYFTRLFVSAAHIFHSLILSFNMLMDNIKPKEICSEPLKISVGNPPHVYEFQEDLHDLIHNTKMKYRFILYM